MIPMEELAVHIDIKINDLQGTFSGDDDIIQRPCLVHDALAVIAFSAEHHPLFYLIFPLYEIFQGILYAALVHLGQKSQGPHIDPQKRDIPGGQVNCRLEQGPVPAQHQNTLRIVGHPAFAGI